MKINSAFEYRYSRLQYNLQINFLKLNSFKYLIKGWVKIYNFLQTVL